jgi:alpha/beta superfamily hydrolase
MEVFLYLALFLFGWQFGLVVAAASVRRRWAARLTISATPSILGAFFVLAWVVS